MSDWTASLGFFATGSMVMGLWLHVQTFKWRQDALDEQHARWKRERGYEMSRHVGQGGPGERWIPISTQWTMASLAIIITPSALAALCPDHVAWVWDAIARNRGFSTMALGMLVGFWASYRFLRKRGELR